MKLQNVAHNKKLASETLFPLLVRQMIVKRVYGGRGLVGSEVVLLERTNELSDAAVAAVKLRYVVYSNVPPFAMARA